MSNKTLSSDYLMHLMEFLAEERGLTQETIQKNLGFDLSAFLHWEKTISLDVFTQVMSVGFVLTKDPALHLGFAKRLTSDCHGLLGYMAKSQETVEDAIIAHVKYLKTRNSYVQYTLVKGEESATLVLDVRLGNPFYRRIAVETLLRSIEAFALQWIEPVKAVREQRKKQLANGGWTMPGNSQGVAAVSRVRSPKVGVKVLVEFDNDGSTDLSKGPYDYRFNQPINGLLIPNKILQSKLNSEDPALSRLCESKLETHHSYLYNRTPFSEQVKKVIQQKLASRCTLTMVAREMCISDRTLKRRLKNEDKNFRQLLNECRMERALTELPSNSVAHVSELLGFQNQFSFSRAFKNWTGRSPSEYSHW